MGRTSYTSNMFSLKLVLCVCIFFVIGMEGAPKPKPKAEPKPQPKAEPKPQPKAEPKPFPPIRYPPHSGGFNLPGANPGPWNLNGFPPTRGANPGPWNLNGFPPTRGYYPWQRNWNRLQMNRINRQWWNEVPKINYDPLKCNRIPDYKHYTEDVLDSTRKKYYKNRRLYGKCNKIKYIWQSYNIDGDRCFDKDGCQPKFDYLCKNDG